LPGYRHHLASSSSSSHGWLCGLHTSSSSSSKKGVTHAAAAAAAAPAGHAGSHGSLSAAHGPSSYELAAEKMSDREILATLAQHLWPKGELWSNSLSRTAYYCWKYLSTTAWRTVQRKWRVVVDVRAGGRGTCSWACVEPSPVCFAIG
jgi:hypothetical protein